MLNELRLLHPWVIFQPSLLTFYRIFNISVFNILTATNINFTACVQPLFVELIITLTDVYIKFTAVINVCQNFRLLETKMMHKRDIVWDDSMFLRRLFSCQIILYGFAGFLFNPHPNGAWKKSLYYNS